MGSRQNVFKIINAWALVFYVIGPVMMTKSSVVLNGADAKDLSSPAELGKDKSICHVYGDPHVIHFSQQTHMNQDQYWCRIYGVHRVLKNSFVEIIVLLEKTTWLIDEYVMKFLDGNNTVLCTIDNNEQNCDHPEIKITHPSLSHISILHVTSQLHISIVPHEYELKWYDISVRMPNQLIDQSSGLCIHSQIGNCTIEKNVELENTTSPLAKSICFEYLTAAVQASEQLGLSNTEDQYNNALIACIHDYETTGNTNFGASIVEVIVKDGIHKQQLEDIEFTLQTIKSINIIDSAVMKAVAQIDMLLLKTTENIVEITSIPNTVMISNFSLTTKSDGSIVFPPHYIFVTFSMFLSRINLIYCLI